MEARIGALGELSSRLPFLFVVDRNGSRNEADLFRNGNGPDDEKWLLPRLHDLKSAAIPA